MIKNLQSVGFIMSKDFLFCLSKSSDNSVKKLYSEIMPILNEMVGNHRDFKPFYPNFPEQVMELSEAELYLNATLHYWSVYVSDVFNKPDFVWLPEFEKEKRPLLEEYTNSKVIEKGDDKDFCEIFTKIVSSNSSVSDYDKEIVKWFIKNREISFILPSKIPHKEMMSILVGNIENPYNLKCVVKTATDVLRIAVSLSGGDVSLAENTKFVKVNRKYRRFMMDCLESFDKDNLIEDMLRYSEKWKRLGEKLHPGEFKKHIKTNEAFNVIRNGVKYETFNSKVEKYIKNKDIENLCNLLAKRPGIFVRRLDHVLRISGNDSSYVFHVLEKVLSEVSTPVLLQAWNHFNYREKINNRFYFPKGNVAKLRVDENKIPDLDERTVTRAVILIEFALYYRFNEHGEMGKVYIDEDLKNKIVPFSQRSASDSLIPMTRGSSFNLENKSTIRFFIWWKNIDRFYSDNDSDDYYNYRVDIDLTAAYLDEKYDYIGDVSYYNLKNELGHHSGDVIDAPEGASEFIDINLDKLGEDVRYIVMSINSFTRQPFNLIPECYAGWMMRRNPNSGEIFEPKTVENKFTVSSNSKMAIPLIIDVKEKRVYWADMSFSQNHFYSNNVYNNRLGISCMSQAIVELNKLNVYDLYKLHAESRGKVVKSKEKADLVLDSFDINTILSEYMK